MRISDWSSDVCSSDLRVPHDGKTPGRLMIKGPTIAGAYYGGEGGDVLDEEGFFDTGDVSTIDAEGYLQIPDRATDVVQSRGEWISSLAIATNALGHEADANAAVVGVAIGSESCWARVIQHV